MKKPAKKSSSNKEGTREENEKRHQGPYIGKSGKPGKSFQVNPCDDEPGKTTPSESVPIGLPISRQAYLDLKRNANYGPRLFFGTVQEDAGDN